MRNSKLIQKAGTLFLTLSLMASVCPIAAKATENNSVANPSTQKNVTISGSDNATGKLNNPLVKASTTTWNSVTFGNYWKTGANQDGKQPIQWRVLSVNGDDMYLLSEQNLDVQQYNDKAQNESGLRVEWQDCSLNKWLNTIYDLLFKYKAESVEELVTLREQIREKLKKVEGGSEEIERQEKKLQETEKRRGEAILPVQIAYFTGLRLGEVAGLTWQDINLEEQYLTVRRSIRYNGATHKHEIGPTKWKKIRVVDFGDTLADILRNAKKEQHKNRFQYGELYQRNFYREVMEKNRVHYEYYHLGMTENVPEDYTEIFFVCLREDGCLELPATIETACRTAGRKVPELEGFHFHTLRHTYTTNLLSNGAQPKDVQELLGHSDVSTTMNVYAHATREAKRTSARLLDKVAGND